MLGSTLLAWMLVSGVAEGAEASPRRKLNAQRVNETMVIDGRAQESVWQQATFSQHFVERWPGLGKVPASPTQFAIAYDDTNLYVFARGRLSAPKPAIRTLRRDSEEIFNDDTFVIKIDPHIDRRTAFIFVANLAGAQLDGLALEDGNNWVVAWDGVWEVEARINGDVFAYEFRIPFYLLGIRGGKSFDMGLNVERYDPGRNAIDDWQLITPPRSPGAASTFGRAGGLAPALSHHALEWVPYVAGRTTFSPTFTVDPRKNPNLAAGLDLRMQTGKGSYAEASFLTDFSQVDLDEVQVASNRFPLYYPERRPFFLRGLEIFNFGVPGQAQLFFSRRIGLGGQSVPIASGLKAYGRAGPVAYGVLDVQTTGTVKDPNSSEPALGPENFLVARVRNDVGSHFNIGAIALGNHRFQSGAFDSAAAGIDVEAFTQDRLWRAYGFAAASWFETDAKTQRDEPSAEASNDDAKRVESVQPPAALGTSAHASAQYRGLYARPVISWTWSDADFQAPLGFYRRSNAAIHQATFEFVPRPGILGINEIYFAPVLALVSDPSYQHRLTNSEGGYIALSSKQGWLARYYIEHVQDQVPETFRLYDFDIPAAHYASLTHNFGIESPSNKTFSASIYCAVGDFFAQSIKSCSSRTTLRAGRHLTFVGSYTHSIGAVVVPENQFNFGYASGQLVTAITRNLVFDQLVRLNFEPGARQVGALSRMRWRYRPGSDLFVVYRHDRALSPDENGKIAAPLNELTFKITLFSRALF